MTTIVPRLRIFIIQHVQLSICLPLENAWFFISEINEYVPHNTWAERYMYVLHFSHVKIYSFLNSSAVTQSICVLIYGRL